MKRSLITKDLIFRLSFVDENFYLEVDGCQYVELMMVHKIHGTFYSQK